MGYIRPRPFLLLIYSRIFFNIEILILKRRDRRNHHLSKIYSRRRPQPMILLLQPVPLVDIRRRPYRQNRGLLRYRGV